MRDRVYLLGGLRSHIGIRYGIFKTVRPEVLGGEILHRVWSKYVSQHFRIWCFAEMRWELAEISAASRYSRRVFRKRSRL